VRSVAAAAAAAAAGAVQWAGRMYTGFVDVEDSDSDVEDCRHVFNHRFASVAAAGAGVHTRPLHSST
jgi:hypothetical protein